MNHSLCDFPNSSRRMGYMPLYCAAQWIATEGGKVMSDPGDVEKWRPAYRDLLAAISSGAVPVVGMADGKSEPIPAHLFTAIRVD